MCKLLEDMRNEVAAEAKAENKVRTALKMLSKKTYSLDEIAEISDLPLEEIQRLAKRETA